MRAYSNMPTSEFVAQIRDIAINAKASPLVIDQIDAIKNAPSEDEIDARINEAVDEAEEKAFENGKLEGEDNKEKAIEAACKELYKDICTAIDTKGVEIGLTDEQIYKVINHILWDCRP
jgi:hypothetical protein